MAETGGGEGAMKWMPSCGAIGIVVVAMSAGGGSGALFTPAPAESLTMRQFHQQQCDTVCETAIGPVTARTAQNVRVNVQNIDPTPAQVLTVLVDSATGEVLARSTQAVEAFMGVSSELLLPAGSPIRAERQILVGIRVSRVAVGRLLGGFVATAEFEDGAGARHIVHPPGPMVIGGGVGSPTGEDWQTNDPWAR